jgi:steroid delta-isomerase-like uncharacterized protein
MVMVMLSCNPSERNKGLDHVALAQKMFDAFNQHQWQAMANCYSDSARFLDPAFGKTYLKQTRSEVVEKYARFQRAFPDIHDEVIAMYPSENKVIVEFISTGTMAGGSAFKLPIITVLTFENDLIVKDATYYDVENSSDEENSNDVENP